LAGVEALDALGIGFQFRIEQFFFDGGSAEEFCSVDFFFGFGVGVGGVWG